MAQSSGNRGWFFKALGVLLAWVVLAGLAYYLLLKPGRQGADEGEPAVRINNNSDANANSAKPTPIEIGIAYGTEKQRWLNWTVAEWNKTTQGQQIRVNLIPMGSLEGAHAVLRGDQRIHVWSPASSVYREVFEQEWNLNRAGEPIVESEVLALSPMAFVMWKARAEPFLSHYHEISFKTISQALQAEEGWGSIAGKPEWGLFKFGQTHPNQSNSGLLSLVLACYNYHGKLRGLSRADVVNAEFQQWLGQLQRGVSGLSNSTGNMMREMVLKGPSSFDAVMVYESVAIDYLQNAQGRWGELLVAYPERNMWSDNPYYILNTTWATSAHQQAAREFLAFLMSEPIQRESLSHGFRPGNAAVPVNAPESPFVKFASYGLKIDLPQICEPPPPEVVNELTTWWSRAVGR